MLPEPRYARRLNQSVRFNQTNTMTEEQIRIAIAESQGFENILRENSGEFGGLKGDKGGERKIVPSYCRDLNRMREALKTLTRPQSISFLFTLNEMGLVGEWDILTAKPEHLAEAFLHTIGKWVGDE